MTRRATGEASAGPAAGACLDGDAADLHLGSGVGAGGLDAVEGEEELGKACAGREKRVLVQSNTARGGKVGEGKGGMHPFWTTSIGKGDLTG